MNPDAWDAALAASAEIFRACAERAIVLGMVNLGGGFPARYLKKVPTVERFGAAIFRALSKHFGNRLPETIIEPPPVSAGTIEAEVVLICGNHHEEALVSRTSASSAAWLRPAEEAIRSDPHPQDGDDKFLHYRRADLVIPLTWGCTKQPYALPVSLRSAMLSDEGPALTTTHSTVSFTAFAAGSYMI
jgi:ornithine decarboxylase